MLAINWMDCSKRYKTAASPPPLLLLHCSSRLRQLPRIDGFLFRDRSKFYSLISRKSQSETQLLHTNMDAIGAIASVAQLTSYLVGSLAYAFEVYQKVKSRPEKLRLQFREVEVLRFIVIEIRKIPALHKPNIQSQLHSLTDFVGSLVAVLNKLLAQQSRILAKRFLKIWIKDTENVRLESILTTIERQKNSLILSIATVQTDLQSVLLRFCVRKRSRLSLRSSLKRC